MQERDHPPQDAMSSMDMLRQQSSQQQAPSPYSMAAVCPPPSYPGPPSDPPPPIEAAAGYPNAPSDPIPPPPPPPPMDLTAGYSNPQSDPLPPPPPPPMDLTAGYTNSQSDPLPPPPPPMEHTGGYPQAVVDPMPPPPANAYADMDYQLQAAGYESAPSRYPVASMVVPLPPLDPHAPHPSEAPPPYPGFLPPVYSAREPAPPYPGLQCSSGTSGGASPYIPSAQYLPSEHDKAVYAHLLQTHGQPPEGSTVITAQPQAQQEQQTQTIYGLFSRDPHRPHTWLGVSVFTCLCCNCIFGLIAICFSVMSSSAYAMGDVEGARRHANVALALSLFGMTISVLGLIFMLSVA